MRSKDKMRVSIWSRCMVFLGAMLLSGLFMNSQEAHAIRLDIKFNSGTAIPGDNNTNLTSGNNAQLGAASARYVTLLSETSPAEATTNMQEAYAVSGTWYAFANTYYKPSFTSVARLSANATASFRIKSSNASDQFRVTLWHVTALGVDVGQLGNSNTFNGTVAASTYNIDIANAQYDLPAGDMLKLKIEFKPSANNRVGYIYCNSAANSQSYLTIGIKFSVTSSAGAGGTITGPATTPGTAWVDYKSTPAYTITPNGGQHIQSLDVSGASIPGAVGQTAPYVYTFPSVTSNRTISAQFQLAAGTFSIAPGNGGCITAQGYTACPGAGSPPWAGGSSYNWSVAPGAYIFDVVPAAGYGISQVLVHGVDQGVTPGQTTLWSIPAVTLADGESKTVAASFLPYYTVTGTVSGVGGAISPATQPVLSGQSITYTITPDNGYKLATLTDNGAVVASPTTTYTISNVVADHAVVATFLPTYNIQAIAGPNGTISPIGDTVVDSGTNRNFSMTANLGYRVDTVVIDGVQLVDPVTSYTFSNVTANHTIEVTFVEYTTPSTYCAVPAFITTPAPPNVMLMLSVESPMEGAANPSVTCTGTPSALNYSCTSSGLGVYDNTRNYYGYFENNKCYTYAGTGATGLFSPSGAATNHQCAAGTAWSGNMLNYATTLAVDAFRKAFTGGNRTVDVAAGDTVLLAAHNDGSWFDVYPRVDHAELYMPFAGDVTRYLVRKNGGSGFGLCNAGQTSCTVTRSATTGEVQWPVIGANTGSVYSLRIKACSATGGVESRCNTTTNKPEGTIQRYMSNLRFALMSYAADNTYGRDGGILREKMKWVGPKVPYGLKYHDASNVVQTCTTVTDCDNPEKEVNTDGTFVNNPDAAASGNSGVINYINKFAYTSGYKGYDPAGEMYYEVVRYFKNLVPSVTNYCSGITEPNDGFAVYCNATKTNARGWRDPTLYPCSQNFVIAVNDANPWLDKRIPGSAFKASYGGNAANDYCGTGAGDCDTDFLDGGTQIDVEGWTNKVGDLEGLTGTVLKVACEVNAAGACITSTCGATPNVGFCSGGKDVTISKLGRIIGTPPYQAKENSYNVAGLAYYAHSVDLRPDLAATGKIRNLTTYMIDTQEPGGSMLVGPKNMLQLAAKYGGFEDKDNDQSVTMGSTNYNRPYSSATCGGVSATPNVYCSEWDADNDGFPDNYFFASDSSKVESGLYKAFASILNRATSGTAAAVANNRSGERGANIIQALFYPQWPTDMGIKWLGDVQALWFYLDPVIKFSGIFEDTDGDRELNLRADLTPSSDATKVNALWKAGDELHARTASTRSIYTLLDPSSVLTNTANAFTTTNRTTLKPLLGIGASTDAQADVLINYIRGLDGGAYRSRTVTRTGITNNAATGVGVWKLGDIINSTPQIQGADPLNNYTTDFGDSSYSKFTVSSNYKTNNFVYTGSNDGMLHAFRLGLVGRVYDSTNLYRIANILDETDLGKEEWAFIPSNALPYMKNCADAGYCHQYLVDGTPVIFDAAINKYTACTEDNYWSCERTTTYNLGTTALNLAATSWKSVLIGSMGLGGATRDGNCNETLSKDDVESNNTDCIKTPNTGTVAVPVTDKGFSSYFALDITTPTTPGFMWEFSDASIEADTSLSTAALKEAAKGLGLTTASPAIVRINSPMDNHKNNGRWFAVFASGPTGPIDTATKQFLGRSDQNLKIYVVDINPFKDSLTTFKKCSAVGATECNYWVFDTGKKFAFATSLINSTVDLDKGDASTPGYWSDDVVYVSYVKASLATTGAQDGYPLAWDKGGVVRLITKNDPDPANWFVSTLIDDIGPVTRSVDVLQSKSTKKLWVYFGEGRYFYNGDDLTNGRKIYGVADPCYSYDLSHLNQLSTEISKCPAVNAATQLKDQTSTPTAALATTDKGWYINLYAASGTSGAERMTGGISANTNGVVFFTTFVPSSDLCVAGGYPSGWAVNASTGGTAPAGSMEGKLILTTSDQPIAKPVNIKTLYTEEGGRKMSTAISTSLKGMPPPQPPPNILLPAPSKRILNIQER